MAERSDKPEIRKELTCGLGAYTDGLNVTARLNVIAGG